MFLLPHIIDQASADKILNIARKGNFYPFTEVNAILILHNPGLFPYLAPSFPSESATGAPTQRTAQEPNVPRFTTVF